MKFTLFRRLTLRGYRWFFNLKASNGEIIAQSEGYHNRGDALETIELVRSTTPSTPIEVVK